MVLTIWLLFEVGLVGDLEDALLASKFWFSNLWCLWCPCFLLTTWTWCPDLFSSPNFSKSARAVLNLAKWDSVLMTVICAGVAIADGGGGGDGELVRARCSTLALGVCAWWWWWEAADGVCCVNILAICETFELVTVLVPPVAAAWWLLLPPLGCRWCARLSSIAIF